MLIHPAATGRSLPQDPHRRVPLGSDDAGGEAIAGDYSVTLNADGQNVKDSVDLRFAVKTTAWWGVGGVGIIAAAVAGLLWTFRRFGRR